MIDTTTDTVTQTIKVGTSPLSMTVSGTKLYVHNKDTKSISIIYTAAPALRSFSSDAPDATYAEGATIDITAFFDQKLASTSTMTILMNNGVELTLNTVEDQALRTNYAIRPGDDIGDLSVRSIKTANIVGVSGLKANTNYALPVKKNIGDLKNIAIATSYPTLNCSATTGSKLYRKCSDGTYATGIKSIIDNLICEGFITKQTEKINYRTMKPLSRIEALDVAVKMLRVTAPKEADYQQPFQDIPKENSNPLTPIIETGLANNLISTKNTRFEPQRRVSRAEAYIMVLKSVCFPLGEGTDWKSILYTPIFDAGMTTLTWDVFKPDQAILRKEFFTIVSRASDWANKTG